MSLREGGCMFHPQVLASGARCKLCNFAPIHCLKCCDQSVCSLCCCCGSMGVQFAKCNNDSCKGYYTACIECFHKFNCHTQITLQFTELCWMLHSCERYFEKNGTKWIPYADTNFTQESTVTADVIIATNPTIAALLRDDALLPVQ